VSRIGDLVSGTSCADKPDLIIRLRLVEPLIRARSIDGQCTGPTVVIRSGAKADDGGGLSQFYRIGDVPRKPNKDYVIQTSEAFFWRRRDKSGEFTRRKASTWTLRNFEICSPDKGESVTEVKVTASRTRGYDKDIVPERKHELEEKVKDGSAPLFTDGRTLYSFKPFGTGANSCPNPAKSVPSSGISVALRFVNYLEGEEARSAKFNDTVELVLDANDSPKEIFELFKEEFGKPEYGKTTKALVNPPLLDQWQVQLWILPQIPDCRTLFQYKDGGAGLASFLNRPEKGRVDRTLFMEVHLIPKDVPAKPKESPRSARAVKKGPVVKGL
jgi:hypothetical protein